MANNAIRNITGSVERALHLRDGRSEDPESQAPFIQPTAESSTSRKDKWTPLLVTTGFFTMMGSAAPAGYNIGVLNSPQEVIKSFCNNSIYERYDSVLDATSLDLLWSFVVSVFLLSGCVGALGGGPIANKIGRKNTLLLNATLSLLSSICFGVSRLANSVELLLLGRLFVGFGGGLSSSFMPMFLSEISPVKFQHIMGILCPLGFNVGLVASQILSLENLLGNDGYWPVLLSIPAIPSGLCIASWFFLPESPRYLYVAKRNKEAAINNLCRLRKQVPSKVAEEVKLYDAEVSGQSRSGQNDDWTLLRILRNDRIRSLSLVIIVFHLSNQLSGINAVFYYSTAVFQSAGLDRLQAQLANLGAGCVNLAMVFIAMPLTSRFGRRPLMLWSCGSTAACLVILSLTISFINHFTWMPIVCIVSLLAYVFAFGIGISAIPFFIANELVPAGPRPLVMSIGCMVNWCMNFTIGMSFPFVQQVTGPYAFIIFAIFTAMAAVFFYYRLEETKNRPPPAAC